MKTTTTITLAAFAIATCIAADVAPTNAPCRCGKAECRVTPFNVGRWQYEPRVPRLDASVADVGGFKGRHAGLVRINGANAAGDDSEKTWRSVKTAQKQFKAWVKLEETLLVKFIDGNVKAQDAKGNFLHTKYHDGTPEGLTQPGYTDRFKKAIVRDNGETLRSK